MRPRTDALGGPAGGATHLTHNPFAVLDKQLFYCTAKIFNCSNCLKQKQTKKEHNWAIPPPPLQTGVCLPPAFTTHQIGTLLHLGVDLSF